MKILAIESSGRCASAALLSDGMIKGEYTLDTGLTHSETLLPLTDSLLKGTGGEKPDVIAVSAGPGSFTGLRIGAAMVKGLADGWKAGVIAVPTLEALAYRFYGYEELICPLMDARRGQVYGGVYTFAEGNKLETLRTGGAYELKEVLEYINGIGKKVIFLGDGTDRYEEVIKEEVKVPFLIAAPHKRYQSAACVAMYAYEAGEEKVIPAQAFVPEYMRMSQAERERAEKGE
ncbi:MAG: tRNA (adenosine(37)-N6)-threonylcarbamoyltransferase complex dimerization subunit type 1 TsaB [Lachnospiraceae bacterium]|nr:tRNA (adenosine(37)-N6)-threonylcarbamoyltransferase complex dimerization subunit type 1 TsaB [Lachnospiraceae bacterium]